MKAAPVTAKILSDAELAELTDQEAASTSSTIAALADQNSSSQNQSSDSLNNEQLAMLDATVTQRSAKNNPSLNIRVFDNILTIDGSMASSDDTSKLVQDALNSFDKDIVTNGITQQDDVASAEWLAALQQIMPLMRPLDGAQIGITEQQMTLAGVAPNRAIHDSVINEALASMGDFSLIEKITVSDSQSSDVNTPMVLTAAVQAQQPAKESAEQLVAQAEAENLAKIEAEKQARLKAEAAARAKAEAAAKAKAEEQERLRVEAEQKARAEEQARLKAAAEKKAKEEEQARLQAEAAQKAKAEEQARLQAEAEKKAQEEEQAQLAAVAAAEAARAKEEAILLAQAKTEAEETARIQADAEAAAKAAEEAQLKAEVEARLKADAGPITG